VKAGKYKAKKIGGDFGETKGGKPYAGVLFSLVDTGETITWYGYFTDAARPQAMQVLELLGVNRDLKNIADAHDGEFNLVIVEEPNLDGVPVCKVRWVNPGSGDGLAMGQRLTEVKIARLADELKGSWGKVSNQIDNKKDSKLPF
jgi:hypothetical protein